jgi:hypothetical protein
MKYYIRDSEYGLRIELFVMAISEPKWQTASNENLEQLKKYLK